MEPLTRKKEDKIFQIIDRVLKGVFGETATELIYRHLESRYSLSRNEFSDKFDVFAKGIEDFLTSGAYLVENRILDEILNDIYPTRGQERGVDLRVINSEEPDFAGQIKFAERNA
jgi:hypothetical protein